MDSRESISEHLGLRRILCASNVTLTVPAVAGDEPRCKT